MSMVKGRKEVSQRLPYVTPGVQETEAVAYMCSVKKVFLEISQNIQENTCARLSLFNKITETLVKKRIWQGVFL